MSIEDTSHETEGGNSTPGASAGGVRVVWLTPHEISERTASAVLGDGSRRIHFGLFPGRIGRNPSHGAAIAYHGIGDTLAYTAARHLAHLLQPALIVHVAPARAVAETLADGDLAVVREAVPCWCPPALAENLVSDPGLLDALSRAAAGPLGGETAKADPATAEGAVACLSEPVGRRGAKAVLLRVGSTPEPLHGWLARDFVRARFAVDATDHDAHGFLLGCTHSGVRGIAVRVICNAENAESGRMPRDAWEIVAAVARRR
jgi:hypothetical protein